MLAICSEWHERRHDDTNRATVLGHDTARLEQEVLAVLEGRGKKGRVPDLWDGKAAVRIAEALA